MSGPSSRPETARDRGRSTAEASPSPSHIRDRDLPVTVMMVHRDATVRRLSQVVLERKGCHVIALDDGPSALRRLHADAADVLIIDLSVGWARAVVRRARHVRPSVRVVFVSRAFSDIVGCAPNLASGETFLEEPFGGGGLVEAVELVRHWPAILRSGARP